MIFFQVTNRNIVVINGDNESNWNRIHPQIKDSVKSDPIYLGHVGELHYVSMRPVGKAGEIFFYFFNICNSLLIFHLSTNK